MEKQRLLEIRKRIKRRKPKFMAQDSHKKKRVEQRWRRPRGIHSKMRHNLRGYKLMVQKGYGSPNAVSGLHPTGLRIVRAYSLKDIEGVNPKDDGIMIAGVVGLKKKVEIAKKAHEKGITVLNIKDVPAFLKETAEMIASRKAEKSKKEEDKDKKRKEAEKKAEEKKKEEKLSEKLSEEDKKEQENKEKEKVLTMKG